MRLARLFASLATLVSVGFGNAIALFCAVTRIDSSRFTSLLMRVTLFVETVVSFFSDFSTLVFSLYFSLLFPFSLAKRGIATITRTVSSATVAFRDIKPPPVELVEMRATFGPAFRSASGVRRLLVIALLATPATALAGPKMTKEFVAS